MGTTRGRGRRAGNVRERAPGVWQVSAPGPVNPTTGVRGRKWVTIHGGRRDAERALAILIADLDDGRVVAGAGTFAELLDDWWHTMATHRWEDATAIRHRQDISVHLAPTLGRRKLDELQAADFTRLYTRMSSAGAQPRTVQHVHNTARAALNHAIRQGLLSRNAAAAAVVPIRKRRSRRLPGLDELAQVLQLATADGDGMWGCWFRVAFWTGARPAEVCALRWAHINVDRAEIRFERAIGRKLLDDGRIGWHEKGTKTQSESNTGARTVSVDLMTVAALRRWRTDIAARLLEVGERLDDSMWVFPSDRFGWQPLTPSTPSRRWRRYAAQCGIGDDVRLYDAARHHHVSWCLTMGFPVAEVAERVGNSPETIYRTYAHLLGGDTRGIADAIDRAAAERTTR